MCPLGSSTRRVLLERRVSRAAALGIGLGLSACGELLPPNFLDDSTTDSGATSTSASTSATTSATTTPSVDDTSTSTSTSTASGSTSGSVEDSTGTTGAPTCGNGMVEAGEVCYGELEEVVQLGQPQCGIAIGDVFYDDEYPELVTAPCPGPEVVILPGSPLGLESAVQYRNLGLEMMELRGIALGDFSGDDQLDLVTPDSPSHLVIVPDLELDPMNSTAFDTSVLYHHVLSAQIGADGGNDVLVGTLGFELARVFSGTGMLMDPFNYGPFVGSPSTDYDAELADIDGRGGPELILATSTAPATIEVYLGVMGGFGMMVSIDLPNLVDVTAAQVDGMPGLELVASQLGVETITVFEATEGISFGAGQQFEFGAGAPLSLAAADLDADGLDDLVSTHMEMGQNTLVLSINLGDGSFDTLMTFPIDGGVMELSGAAALRLVDLNLDGAQDVVVVTNNQRILQLLSMP